MSPGRYQGASRALSIAEAAKALALADQRWGSVKYAYAHAERCAPDCPADWRAAFEFCLAYLTSDTDAQMIRLGVHPGSTMVH